MVQLLERAQAKGERLREARQQLQGLAESLEDMLVTLTEYQALLATKESDPIPHDLNVVDALLKEHQVCVILFRWCYPSPNRLCVGHHEKIK